MGSMRSERSEHEHWTPRKCMNSVQQTSHLTRRTTAWRTRKTKWKIYVKHTQFAAHRWWWMDGSAMAYAKRRNAYNAGLLMETRKLVRTHARAVAACSTTVCPSHTEPRHDDVHANILSAGEFGVWLHLLPSPPPRNHTAAYHLCILLAHTPAKSKQQLVLHADRKFNYKVNNLIENMKYARMFGQIWRTGSGWLMQILKIFILMLAWKTANAKKKFNAEKLNIYFMSSSVLFISLRFFSLDPFPGATAHALWLSAACVVSPLNSRVRGRD